MPSKNVIKSYVENGYYHVYNRGVEKRKIFLDVQDCQVFLRYIKLYLSPLEELENIPISEVPRIKNFLRLNLSKEIDLLAFSLMPNHIHLQIKQHTKDGITKFMRRLITSYVMYFNRKYKRVGSLFQNKYKAVIVDYEEYLLHLSRYIHKNPLGIKSNISFLNYSSYPYYVGAKHASWIKSQEILSYFSKTNHLLSYKSFVEEDVDERIIPEELLLE